MSLVSVTVLFAISLLLGNGCGFELQVEPTKVESPVEVSAPARADEPKSLKPADELARLQKIWDGWKGKTTSLEVEGLEFYGVLDGETSQVSRASLQKLIEEDLPKLVMANPHLDQEALTAATVKLFPPPAWNAKSTTFGRWANVSLIRAADCVKWTMTLGDYSRTTIRRGPIEQDYSPANRQASVYSERGGLNIPEIDMFVFVPKLPADTRPWQLIEAQPTRRQLLLEGEQGSAVQLDYEAVSGLVRYHGLRRSDTQILRERYQSAEVFTKSGIPVSRIVTEIYYEPRQPQTRRVRIYVTTDVELGNEIERENFNLTVPIGTNVILFGGAPGSHRPGVRPPMAITRKVVEDAEEFTRSDEFQNAQRK